MSRIFDALQRSESESNGSGASALAESTELLRRAEQRAASTWESKAVSGGGRDSLFNETILAQGDAFQPNIRVLSEEERQAALSSFADLPLALPADSHLVCLTDPDNPMAEAVRLLGVRLRDLRKTRPLKRLLVTSTIPREGKSTLSANLACALAHGIEEKVLLIGGDVRLPALPAMLGIGNAPGLCETLQDNGDVLKNIYRLEDADFWVLPAGAMPENPLEILESQRLPELLDRVSEIFDWVIIDSPPVLPLADTSIWMRQADGILLVVRQGVTEKRQLQKGLEALDPQKVLGALMNGTTASAYSSYYYRSTQRS